MVKSYTPQNTNSRRCVKCSLFYTGGVSYYISEVGGPVCVDCYNEALKDRLNKANLIPKNFKEEVKEFRGVVSQIKNRQGWFETGNTSCSGSIIKRYLVD